MKRVAREPKIKSGNGNEAILERDHANAQTRIDDTAKDIIKKRPTVRVTKSDKKKIQNDVNKVKVIKTPKHIHVDDNVDDNSDDLDDSIDNTKRVISINVENNGLQINKDVYQQKEMLDLSDGDDIKRIYHISDIHIQREDTRHDEYKEVFTRLYKKISLKTKNSLIVVTGDVTHDKSHLTTLQLDLVKEFFVKLAELCPIILIIGNHDINPNQQIKYGDEINSLSSILRYMSTKNKIHLLLEDRCYQYNNIIFGVTTMFTKKVTEVNRQDDKIHIGLYHGIINGTSLDNEYIMNTSRFNMSDFSNYDLCMFGDIHKFNYLNASKTMAYAGSLIQQNIGEDLLNHGMIEWNITDKTSKFVRIKNDYGFVKVEIDGNTVSMCDSKEIPKHPVFYVYHKNISTEKLYEFVNNIKKKYSKSKCLMYNVQMDDMIEIKFGKNEVAKVLTDLQSDGSVYKMIMSYIFKKENYKKLSPTNKKNFKDLFGKMISDVEYNYNEKVRLISLKSLKFDNFYLYGKGNEIDFTSEIFNNIIGIVGPSYSGKSTIIDVLLYSIFGQCSRGNKYNTINVMRNQMKTIVELSVNDDEYKISRTRIKTNSTKINGESTEKIELECNGEIITKDTLDQTNKKITDIFGEYQDFLNICVILQKDGKTFVDSTEMERRNIITRLLKIDVFEKIYKNAKNTSRMIERDLFETKSRKKELNNYKAEFEAVINEINIITARKNDLSNNISEIKNIINAANESIVMNRTRMENCKTTKKDIDTYEESLNIIAECNKKITKKRDMITKLILEYEELSKRHVDLSYSLLAYDDMEIKHEKFVQNQIIEMERLNNEREALLSSKKMEMSIDFDIKMIQNKLRDDIKRQDDNNKNIKLLDDQINSHEDIVFDNEKQVVRDYDKYIKLCSQKREYENTLTKLNDEYCEIGKKLDKIKNHKFDPECEFCMAYPTTVDKMTYEAEIDRLRNDIRKYTLKLNVIKKRDEEYEKYKNKYEKLQQDKIKQSTELVELERCNNHRALLSKDCEILKVQIDKYNMMITSYEDNQKIKHQNENIDAKCKEIQSIIMIKKREYDGQYEIYLNIKNDCEKIMREMTEIHRKIDADEDDIDRLDQQLTYIKNNNNTHQNKIREYKKLSKELCNCEDISEKNNLVLEKLQTEMNDIDRKLEGLRIKREVELENIRKMDEKKSEYDMLRIIISVFDDGMIDDILQKTIFPIIENQTNEIIKNVCDYNVRFKCTGKGVAIEKVRSDGKIINIETLSGCEYVILNIAIRLAIERCNNSLKTTFIFIDEVFRFCDDETIKKIPTIFDYIRQNFEWGVVISHDDRIIQMYDHSVKIKKLNNDMRRIIIN